MGDFCVTPEWSRHHDTTRHKKKENQTPFTNKTIVRGKGHARSKDLSWQVPTVWQRRDWTGAIGIDRLSPHSGLEIHRNPCRLPCAAHFLHCKSCPCFDLVGSVVMGRGCMQTLQRPDSSRLGHRRALGLLNLTCPECQPDVVHFYFRVNLPVAPPNLPGCPTS